MKIRTGFVSNSSSSSFVMFYRTVDISNITPDDLIKSEYGFIEFDGNEETLFVIINEESLKLCQQQREKQPEFVEIIYKFFECDKEDGGVIPNDVYERIKGTRCATYTLSQHVVEHIDELNDYFNFNN